MEPAHPLFPNDPSMEEEFGFYRNFLTSLVQEEGSVNDVDSMHQYNIDSTQQVFVKTELNVPKEGFEEKNAPRHSLSNHETFYSDFVHKPVDLDDVEVPSTVMIQQSDSVDDSDLEPLSVATNDFSRGRERKRASSRQRRPIVQHLSVQPDPPEGDNVSLHSITPKENPEQGSLHRKSLTPKSGSSSRLFPKWRKSDKSVAVKSIDHSRAATDIESGVVPTKDPRQGVRNKTSSLGQRETYVFDAQTFPSTHSVSSARSKVSVSSVVSTSASSGKREAPSRDSSSRKHTPLPRPYDRHYSPENTPKTTMTNDADSVSSSSASSSTVESSDKSGVVLRCCDAVVDYFALPRRGASSMMLLGHLATSCVGLYAFANRRTCCGQTVELEQIRILRILSLTYFCWVLVQSYPVVDRNYMRYWTLPNPYFGFLFVAGLAVESQRVFASAVFSLEVLGLALQWILLKPQWNDLTWRWTRLVLTLLPLVLVVFSILVAYYQAPGQCIVLDDNGVWTRTTSDSCILCAGDGAPRSLDMTRGACARPSPMYSSEIWGQEGNYCGLETNQFCFTSY